MAEVLFLPLERISIVYHFNKRKIYFLIHLIKTELEKQKWLLFL